MTALARFTIVAVAALACGVSAVSAQSLGDVAKKEEQRRKATKASGKVYTNKDLGPAPASPLPPASQTAGPGGATDPAAAKAAEAQPGSEQAADDPAKTEQYWRDRVEKTQAELTRNELLLDALQSRVNALATDFVNRDDPAQRAVVANNRQKTLDEMARVQDAIAQLKKQLVDIEEEARQAGVPPGWIR
ncbi:MAG TPA: hypothetical protein VK886_00835 [Vicinamibacterales bacterium]|nr:hypothetical protein [Vicinamibacterales bacterium]